MVVPIVTVFPSGSTAVKVTGTPMHCGGSFSNVEFCMSSGRSSFPIYVAPAVEYGYSVQQVSSSMSITISTQNVTAYPTIKKCKSWL